MTATARTASRLGALIVSAWLAGCSDRAAGPKPVPSPVLFLSNPGGAPGAMADPAALGAARAAADEVAYVSLPPGAARGGARISIRNLATGFTRADALLEGGLDPVPVPAMAGDTLELVVTDGAGATLSTIRLLVPPRRPPVVVRTVPPKEKTDVPLNGRMEVVFSEPIDPATLTATSVQLLRDGTEPVGGRLVPGADRLTASFTPDAPLAAQTEYLLVVTRGVRDLDGDPLDAAVVVPFRTGTPSAVSAVSVEITPAALTIQEGGSPQLTAITRFKGLIDPYAVVTWQSAEPRIVEVEPTTGRVTAAIVGQTTISASSGGTSATASITVLPRTSLVFASIAAGSDRSCGLTPVGEAYCWGNDLGRPTNVLLVPVAVPGGLRFASLALGGAHSCGLTAAGAAYCWGSNGDGQVGDGSTTFRPAPVPVSGGLSFGALVAGDTHSCGLTTAGAAYCWGGYWYTVGPGSLVPAAVSGGLRFAALTVGGAHTCGLTADGAAYCWGYNDYGQLGDPATACAGTYDGLAWFYCHPWVSMTPVKVAGDLAFASLAAGKRHSCGLARGGEPYCWGITFWRGETTSQVCCADALPLPEAVTASGLRLASITASAGAWHVCGLTARGEAYCWGSNEYGQLGAEGDSFDNYNFSLEPVAVGGGLTFISTRAGGRHSCGLSTAGVVYCWGNNALGQLGDGTTAHSQTPVRVAGQP